MKTLALILIPVCLISFLFIQSRAPAKITDEVITRLIKEKIPDSIPIEDLSAHLNGDHLELSGTVFGKIPLLCDFSVSFEKNSIVLKPQSITANGIAVSLDFIAPYFEIKNGKIILYY